MVDQEPQVADDAPRSELERYREAAEETLNQLDWCIAYLYRIRKPAIAAAISANKAQIRRTLHGKP
jgi:hypothetical protein